MKRFLLLSVSVLVFLMMFALPLNAAQTDGGGLAATSSAPPPTFSGGCGDDGNTSTSSNVIWSFDVATSVLTISGSGEMMDYTHPHFVPYFFLKDSIQSIVIESGVTGIGNGAFNNCVNLTSVTIAGSVTSIGDYAFINCEKLTEFIIPDNITSIGEYAFSNCWRIATLTIGEGVTSIGKGAFAGLAKLTVIQWNAKNVSDFAQWDNVFACSGAMDDGITVTFGAKVTSIPAYAFYGSCNNSPKIIAVNLSDGITTIGDYAFKHLRSLTSITIPFATNAIGSHAFSGCHNDFLIYGYTFSYAETYADENNIPFSSLGYKYFDILYYDGEDTLTLTPAQYAYGVGETSLPTPEKTGHSFDGWYDNEDLTGDAVTAIGTTQTGTVSLYAKCTLLTYDITVNAGSNGSISPDSATVAYGDDQSFSITPDEGYAIKDVLVDGTSVGAVSSYEFENVTAAHSIAATFSKQTFSVTVDAGENGSISPASATVAYGDDQSFTITPDEGYEIKDVLVDGTSVGAVSSYEFKNVTAAHSIAATFKKVISITFIDVPKGSWFEAYVYDLVKKGILCGYANDNGTCEFRPYQNITRAEFAAILARVSGEDLSGYTNKTSFNDVSSTFWAVKEIEWAYQNGVVKGVGGDKFAPNSYITRQEMAAMIYRFATVYKGETLPQTDDALTFSDNGDIASWAADAVAAMQLANIIDGIANGDGTFSFAPQSNATRAQAAKMISIYLSL